MKKKILIKKLMALSTTSSLMLTAPYSFVFAQSSQAPAATSYQKDESIVPQLLNFTGGLASTVTGMVNQNAMNANQLAMQSRLANLAAQAIQLYPPGSNQKGDIASLFKNCSLPPAISPRYQEALCEGNGPGSQVLFNNIAITAERTSNKFSEYLTDAQNSGLKSGLSCLIQEQKTLGVTYDTQMTSIQEQIKKFEDENNNARQAAEDQKRAMKDLANEIDGSKSDSGDITKSIGSLQDKYFSSPECASIDAKIFEANGLKGIQQNLALYNRTAGTSAGDKANSLAELDTVLNNMKNESKNGFSSQKLNNYYISKLPLSVRESAQNELMSINQAYQKANDIIRKNTGGYELPPLDGKFEAKTANMKKDISTKLTKKKVWECIDGSQSTGVPLSMDQILASLKNSDGSTLGDVRKKYAKELFAIINDRTLTPSEISSKLKSLDESTVRIKTSGPGNGLVSPYAFYMQTVKHCEEKISEEKEDKTNMADQSSDKQIVQEAIDEFNAINEKQKTFFNTFSAQIKDEFNSCSGKQTGGSSSCSLETFDKNKNPNFCFAEVDRCNANINSCFARANTQLKAKQDDLKALATKFNKTIGLRYNIQVARANELKAATMAILTNMSRTYNIPMSTSDDLPKIPAYAEKVDPEIGVPLIFGGQYEDSFQMAKSQMNILIKKLEDQKNNLNKEASEYIEKQKVAMGENKKYWESIAKKCSEAAKQMDKESNQNRMAQEKQMQEDFNKKQDDINKACYEYDRYMESDSTEQFKVDNYKILGYINQQALAAADAKYKAKNKEKNNKENGSVEFSKFMELVDNDQIALTSAEDKNKSALKACYNTYQEVVALGGASCVNPKISKCFDNEITPDLLIGSSDGEGKPKNEGGCNVKKMTLQIENIIRKQIPETYQAFKTRNSAPITSIGENAVAPDCLAKSQVQNKDTSIFGGFLQGMQNQPIGGVAR